MASQKLTDATCRKLKCPAGRRSKIYFDSEVTGLGLRVTAAGARSFTLTYRNRVGRDRCITIDELDDLTVGEARAHAKKLKAKVALGQDPQGELDADRKAPTVKYLCERFLEEHGPKLRPSTRVNVEAFIKNDILPGLGSTTKVADVEPADIDRLHRKITKRAPYVANRVVSHLSKMFSLAMRWRMRTDNPAKGVERNPEVKRTRYLTGKETARLNAALDELEDQRVADLVRILMLTGARRGEVLSMQWAHVDLEEETWTKPGHTTKQKTEHRVPLSEAALEIIARQPKDALFVFPGATGQRKGLRKTWARVTKRAGLEGLRLHDLRHSFASNLASSGLSLPVIGRLLGHTQPATTARYAHLLDEPLRAGVELAAAAVRTARSTKVEKLRP
jgi:integrase